MSDARLPVLPSFAAALADRYRLERELGRGGMATVYLAHDLRHDRPVAIKVLHADLAAALGAERFLAEIKTTARLQHPHILPLLDSGGADGLLYYVMPYVAGESLRDRLTRERQLPLEDAVRIAREVADALGHAHAHGIIHRDIKPENILLQEGHALVADFGIALAVTAAGGPRMTQTGLSLGTPQYMAPEQAMGERTIDHRADLYALGTVTYEMLAGEPPFTGPTVQAVVARVIGEDPRPITRIRKTVPPHVQAAVLTALAKLPADRWSSATEFAEALAGDRTTTVRTGPVAVRVTRRWALPAVAAVAVVSAALGALAMAGMRAAPDDGAVPRHLSIVLPDSVPLALAGEAPGRIGRRSLALSPDGSALVYVGWYGSRTHLFVRPLGEPSVRRLEGTEGAYAPFFSPDGSWVGFLAGGVLKKVALAGGAPVVLAPAPDVYEAAWLRDGRILFATGEGLRPFVVSGDGVDSARAVRFPGAAVPSPIPGRDEVVGSWFAWAAPLVAAIGDSVPMLLTPDGFERRTTVPVMMPSGSPQVDAAGYLLAADDGRLHAIRFSLDDLQTTGGWIPLDVGVRQELFAQSAQFTLGGDGTLAYVPGANAEHSVLVIEDRDGRIDTLPYPPARYWNPAFSPDGRRIAVTVRVDRGVELRVLDAAGREPAVTIHRSSEQFNDPVWTPAGDSLRFTIANGPDAPRPMRIAVTGGTPAADSAVRYFEAVSRDGRWTAWGEPGGNVLLRDGSGPEVRTPIYAWVSFSPDGRWLIGTENGTRGYQLVALPVPPGGTAYPVNQDGCAEAYWMPSGTAFRCFRPDGYLYEVPLIFDRDGVRGGTARRVSRMRLLETPGRTWSLSRDGNRMLHVATAPGDSAHVIHVVTNFRGELARRFAAQGEPARR